MAAVKVSYSTEYVCVRRHAVVDASVQGAMGLPERVASAASIPHPRIRPDESEGRPSLSIPPSSNVAAHQLQRIQQLPNDVRKSECLSMLCYVTSYWKCPT